MLGWLFWNDFAKQSFLGDCRLLSEKESAGVLFIMLSVQPKRKPPEGGCERQAHRLFIRPTLVS